MQYSEISLLPGVSFLREKPRLFAAVVFGDELLMRPVVHYSRKLDEKGRGRAVMFGKVRACEAIPSVNRPQVKMCLKLSESETGALSGNMRKD